MTRAFRLLLATALAAGFLAVAQPAHAGGGLQQVFVTTTDDVVDGLDAFTSLREAVTTANGTGNPVLINLTPSTTYLLDICNASHEDANASGDLDLVSPSSQVSILGFGTTIEQTCADERVFHVQSTPLELAGVTITGGDVDAASGADALGGGVLTDDTLLAHQCRFTDNAAKQGGAIFGTAGISVTECSLDGNTATSSYAAAVGNTIDAGVELTRSTVTGNTAPTGIVGSAQDLEVENSTVSGNTTTNTGPTTSVVIVAGNVTAEHSLFGLDANTAGSNLRVLGNLTSRASIFANSVPMTSVCDVAGTTTSQGRNLVAGGSCGLDDATDANTTVDALDLGALADNGGPGLTRMPDGESPAIDRIPAAECTLTVDQRSATRPRTGQCDVGPVEVGLRPDGHLRVGAAFQGNDDYDARLANQVVTTTKRRGQTATFVVRAENDGETVDDLFVRGLTDNANFTVRYRVGGENVTADATSGNGYLFLDVPPGGRRTMQVTVTVKNSAAHGASRTTTLRVLSGGGRTVDVLGAKVKVL